MIKDFIPSLRFLKGSRRYRDTNMKNKLSVTIVIPAWNEEAFIEETIAACLEQTHECSIIVVDDNSTDNTKKIAEQFSDFVQVITTDVNKGSKSRALNYALPLVKTDIFVCVDADTILAPDAIEQLVKAFSNPDVMVASGFVLSKNSKNIWESGRYGDYLMGQTIVKSAQENSSAVLVASGCMFAIRSWFLKKHNFSERTMAEDMDLTWLAIEKGFEVVFVKNAYCRVSDPYNYHTYSNQVSRWYRGFFQNIKARNYNLFSLSIRLGCIAYAYMFVNLIGTPLLIYAIVYSMYTMNSGILYGFGMSFLLVFVFAAIEGWKLKDNLIEYPRHIMNCILLAPIVYYLYVKSFVQEIILKQELKEWIKGH